MKRFLLLAVLLWPALLLSQGALTGKVVSATDPAGMPGVSIAIKNTTRGTITDVDGNFSIELQNGETLVFSFVSYKTQEIPFNGQTNLIVTLVEDAAILDEVVVVGYSSIEKKDIT